MCLDCEGAGEQFRVTTLDIDKSSKKSNETISGQVSAYDKDFFGKPTFLTVSGQVYMLYRIAPAD
jgi:asparaginyl-tRNA synthetase